MSRGLKLTLFPLLFLFAAIFLGGSVLYGQEASSALGDINPNSITATSGSTVITYTLTNSDPDVGDYIDEIRINNPFDSDNVVVTGVVVNGVTNFSVVNDISSQPGANIAGWDYNSVTNVLTILLPNDELDTGEFVDITFTHSGLTISY